MNLTESGQQQPEGAQSWVHDINSPRCAATFLCDAAQQRSTAEAPSWRGFNQTKHLLSRDLRATLYRPFRAIAATYPQWPTGDADGTYFGNLKLLGWGPARKGHERKSRLTRTHTTHTPAHAHDGEAGGGESQPVAPLCRLNTRRSCGGFRCALHIPALREESDSSEVCFHATPKRPVIGLVHTRLSAAAQSVVSCLGVRGSAWEFELERAQFHKPTWLKTQLRTQAYCLSQL